MTAGALVAGAAHGILALVLGGSFTLLGWALSTRFVPREAPLAVRLAGAVTVTLAAATGLFWVLALGGLFRLGVAVPLVAALAAWAFVRAARCGYGAECLRAEWGAVARAARVVFRGPGGWVFGALTGLVGVATIRGLVAPPLGWDGLTYHLLKAGRFVQSGALVTERAPDAWRYYEYFPLGGDLLWAWAMVPFRSGLLIALVDLGIWATVVLGVYASARQLGATLRLATLAAAAVGAMPAVVVFLSTGYVDNVTLAFFALGSVFVLRVLAGAVAEAPLATVALSCMVGVRLTTAPLLALGGLLVFAAVLRGSGSLSRRLGAVTVCLAVGLLGAPTYLRSWLEQGSPFHPIRVVVAGQVLSEGEPALYDTLDRVVSATPEDRRSQPGWASLFYASAPEGWYANPGPGAAILVGLGGLGAAVLLRRRQWGALLWLGFSAVVLLGSLWTAEMTVYRVSDWAHTVGRLLLPGFGALALLAASVAGSRFERLGASLLAVATGAGILWSFPRGLSAAELPGTAILLVALAVVLAALALLARGLRRGGARWSALAGGALVVALGLGVADIVRAGQRYPLYQAAAVFPDGLYHLHPLNQYHIAAWPIWRDLDRPEPLRVAVFAGWDGRGHNIYRFPLLGSRLQNLVLYVPVTRDGSVVNSFEFEEISKRADFRAWLGRLVAARVDVVVSLAPAIGIEAYWIEQSPELFEPLAADTYGLTKAYRFRADRLRPAGPAPSAP
ncbi:MAG: hypothetical protein SF066_01810 [Thermoanaerobaculia bacterium]|nr:hypothetical protein [Thermoanaerobaculia bacterium]